jgi:HPt (histidine-containing phosphotransfer) domain-containing protein
VRVKKPKDTPIYADTQKDKEDGGDDNARTAVLFSMLKKIKGLDVESALLSMDGMYHVYEKMIRLAARLLPETIEKMDNYWYDEDITGFTIEMHGLKGVLRNIGAMGLGNKANQLERAALGGTIAFCDKHYPHFKQLLIQLLQHINEAFSSGPIDEKVKMDREAFACALKSVKIAAEGYDALLAADTLKPLLNYQTDEDTGKLLERTIQSLEVFDCQKALTYINKIKTAYQ